MEILNEKIKLEYDDDKLRLFFIGTGSAFAKTLYQTNLLIVKGKDHVLVDCGAKGTQALHDLLGLSVMDIQTFLPTHSHGDHVHGFEEAAIMGRYVGSRLMNKPKPVMVITDEYQRILWERTLRGGLEYNEVLGEDSYRPLCFTDYFDVIRPTWASHSPREIWKANVGSIELEMFRTNHVPEQASGWEGSFWSVGLIIDNKVIFSGDSRFDNSLFFVENGDFKDTAIIDNFLQQDDVWVFHDCQLFNPGAVHACWDELKNLPDSIKRRMFLTHYGDNWQEFDAEEAGFAGFARQGQQYIF